MKYSLQVVTRNGLVFNDTISINYASLTFYTQGNKFFSIEDATMYNVHILHAAITADITHVKLSHLGRVMFERGNKPQETLYDIKVTASDVQIGKHDTFKVHENKCVTAMQAFGIMRQFCETFKTLGYHVGMANTRDYGIFACKTYNTKHWRSFALAIEPKTEW